MTSRPTATACPVQAAPRQHPQVANGLDPAASREPESHSRPCLRLRFAVSCRFRQLHQCDDYENSIAAASHHDRSSGECRNFLDRHESRNTRRPRTTVSSSDSKSHARPTVSGGAARVCRQLGEKWNTASPPRLGVPSRRLPSARQVRHRVHQLSAMGVIQIDERCAVNPF
jgi:hypothetical protein